MTIAAKKNVDPPSNLVVNRKKINKNTPLPTKMISGLLTKKNYKKNLIPPHQNDF